MVKNLLTVNLIEWINGEMKWKCGQSSSRGLYIMLIKDGSLVAAATCSCRSLMINGAAGPLFK